MFKNKTPGKYARRLFDKNWMRLLAGQFEGDFFLQLVNEVEVARAPFGAGLDIHLGRAAIHGFYAHPDLAVVHFAKDGANGIGGIVRNIFTQQDAIALDDGDGSRINLIRGALVAAGDRVLAPRGGKSVGIAHGFDATGGNKRCRGAAGKN